MYRAHNRDLDGAIFDAFLIDADAISPDTNESTPISKVAKGEM